jgi:hypothetical protein
MSSHDIDFIGVRFLDPTGKVYKDGDFYYRAVYLEKEPEWYTLKIFIKELNKYFGQVKVIDYDRRKHFSPRTLIYCDNKYVN